MDLCSNDHDEICYDSRNCPVCVLRDELQAQIDELEKEIADYKDEAVHQ